MDVGWLFRFLMLCITSWPSWCALGLFVESHSLSWTQSWGQIILLMTIVLTMIRMMDQLSVSNLMLRLTATGGYLKTAGRVLLGSLLLVSRTTSIVPQLPIFRIAIQLAQGSGHKMWPSAEVHHCRYFLHSLSSWLLPAAVNWLSWDFYLFCLSRDSVLQVALAWCVSNDQKENGLLWWVDFSS